MTGVFVRRDHGNTETQTQEGRTCNDRRRDWTVTAAASERQGWLANHQELGGAKEEFLPTAFRGSTALLTPRFQTCSLQNCERIHFCCSKPLGSWYFVTTTLGNYRWHQCSSTFSGLPIFLVAKLNHLFAHQCWSQKS